MDMNRQTITNQHELNSLELHDSRISIIQCDYDKHIVIVPILLDSPKYKNVEAKFLFLGVKKVSVDIYEPWGAGVYVNEVSVNEDIQAGKNKTFSTRILLNSGDCIFIESERIEYEYLTT